MNTLKRISITLLAVIALLPTTSGLMPVSAASDSDIGTAIVKVNDGSLVKITTTQNGKAIKAKQVKTTQGIKIYLPHNAVLKLTKPDNSAEKYTYTYIDKSVKSNFITQYSEENFIFQAKKKGTFLISAQKDSETTSVVQDFIIIVGDDAPTQYNDTVFNVTSPIKMNLGTERTIALNGTKFQYIGVSDNQQFQLKRVSKNVISIRAMTAGTGYISTVDTNGVARMIQVKVRDCVWRTIKNDIVNIKIPRQSVDTIPEEGVLHRTINVAIGTPIQFSKNGNGTYIYYYRNNQNKNVCIKRESSDGTLNFIPTEEKTYIISAIVREKDKSFAKREEFTIIAKGTPETNVHVPTAMVQNTKKRVSYQDTVRTVWVDNKNIKVTKDEKIVEFLPKEAGSFKVVVTTQSGKIYENDIYVKENEIPFKLQRKDFVLDPKQTQQVLFDNPGNRTITYDNANPDIVTIDKNGLITAIKPGNATIMVHTEKQTDKIQVTVNTGFIKLDKSSLEIPLGGSATLKATLEAGSKTPYTFTSSNSEVVIALPDGTLEARDIGTALITAKTANQKTATCKVSVIMPSDVSLKFSSICPTVHVGDTVSVGLNASDTRYNKYIKVSTSSDKASVQYENGKCLIKGLGTGKIVLTAELPNGKKVQTYFYSVGNPNDFRTETSVEKGIDISCFNEGVNYKQLKEQGYTFVIIRSGFGKELSQKDTLFEQHIKGAKEAGLGIGIYHFSYAVDTNAAKQEAYVCNQIISKYRNDIKYGVWFDYEDDSTRYAKSLGYSVNRTIVTDITTTFCDEMEKYGFVAGVYTNNSYGTTYLDMNKISKYLFWYARPYSTNFWFDFDIWQYSFSVEIPSYSTIADGNKVFSTIFKELA